MKLTIITTESGQQFIWSDPTVT